MSYAGNPNSQNQVWSEWSFTIREGGQHVPLKDLEYNVARWLRKGFGSVGKVRVRQTVMGWIVEAILEGAPVQDPAFITSVAEQFQHSFVEPGLGCLASSRVRARLLAGSPQDGRARHQWVEMPSILGGIQRG